MWLTLQLHVCKSRQVWDDGITQTAGGYAYAISSGGALDNRSFTITPSRRFFQMRNHDDHVPCGHTTTVKIACRRKAANDRR
jgi:hypothetical protein